MDSRVQLNKVLLDIEDCISELKKQSEDGTIPINDDSSTLHRFQEKLELILLYGLIEKPGFLATKKSYWNYICTCFTSSKRYHHGINFVKSITALKTPVGYGRAFIRFCLTQKCLADTLQNCFMNEKISRDFYSEQSVPVQNELWSTLVASLYELNELNFDLWTGYTELDISWPKFARKVFASDNENLHCSNSSTPSLHSSTSEENLDALKLKELNEELCEQNKCLRIQVQCLEEEKLRLQSDIENLQQKYLSLQQGLTKDEKESNQVLPTVKDVSTPEEEIDADGSLRMAERTTENELKILEGNNPAGFIVESKMKNISPLNCALPHNNPEMSAVQVLNSSCVKNEDSQNKNVSTAQNSVYISELLLEMRTLIDDLESAVQKSDSSSAALNISHLRKIRNYFEERFSSEIENSKNCLNFTNFVDSFITYIKNYTTKQETVIDSLEEKIDLSIKSNQNLYSRIRTLRNLLHSYGFLKIMNETEIEPGSILLPLSISSFEDISCDIANNPVFKRIIIPLLPILNSCHRKLNRLNEKVIELHFGLDLSQELSNNLITRVQDQEIHLKGVTKEIEEAQQLVSVLKQQHRKLQSSEGILKYDLQEKRKLLTQLKQQLENTRKDFNRVRIKNSKSEAEWNDLHKEFVERHKQASEESGFMDDKSIEDCENDFSISASDVSFPHESTPEKVMCQDVPQDVPTKKRRLELLEEQCQNLHSNLFQSSKKREEIDKCLEIMCKTLGRSNESSESHSFSSSLSAESTLNAVLQASSENCCQSVPFTHDTFNNSPPSSDVGSLESEISCDIPSLCNEANPSDSCLCDSSNALSHTTDRTNSDSFGCTAEYKNSDEASLCESQNLPVNNVKVPQLQRSISHVDSLLTKKKDLEESLKNLEIDKEVVYSEKKKFAHSVQTCASPDEEQNLLNKVERMGERILTLSKELDRITHQLELSKQRKVAALQLQINTQVHKNEGTVKKCVEESTEDVNTITIEGSSHDKEEIEEINENTLPFETENSAVISEQNNNVKES